jgi:predicted transcriptional regulator
MPGQSAKTTTIGVRVRNELRVELVRIAERERRSVSWIVNEAVDEYVKRDAQVTRRKGKAP